MPRRIPVVLAQSPLASPQRRELEEQIVTKLLFESGLDVNVIEHFEHLVPGSTGLLCLEGITGDWVLLGWSERERVRRWLAERQIEGRLGRTRLDAEVPPESPGAPGRTIYFMDLGRCATAEQVVAEVQWLRADLSVQTIPLTGLVPSSSKLAPAKPQKPATRSPVTQSSHPDTPLATAPRAELSDDALEELVDRLDEFDV